MKTSPFPINRQRRARSSSATRSSVASVAALAALASGLLMAALGPLARASDESGATLRLEVSSFRNAKGTLNCRLFTEASSFPDGEGTVTVRAPIDGTQATCAFGGLKPGTYAIAVVHDENGNGKLDKNLVGIPTEGYGVSNNRTYALSSPKWDESKFTVTSKAPMVLQVSLRY